MSHRNKLAAVLLADVSGSTALYQRVGDADALAQISEFIGALRLTIGLANGRFVHSRGDDVLATFEDPAEALSALRKMHQMKSRHGLVIHSGLHFGPVIETDDDIYGSSVNMVARLAAAANDGEVLISEAFVERAGPAHAEQFRYINTVEMKGMAEAMPVYVLCGLMDHPGTTKVGVPLEGMAPAGPEEGGAVAVSLEIDGMRYVCHDGETLSIGRAAGNDLRVQAEFVSRRHAVVEVALGRAKLTDRSSGGTYVKIGTKYEVRLVRDTILLAGEGEISPALSLEDGAAKRIGFHVLRG
ncbi:MAG: FHA domain-containing protein [Pseudomonadota bacterium]